jgi:hypothetical protein
MRRDGNKSEQFLLLEGTLVESCAEDKEPGKFHCLVSGIPSEISIAWLPLAQRQD